MHIIDLINHYFACIETIYCLKVNLMASQVKYFPRANKNIN